MRRIIPLFLLCLGAALYPGGPPMPLGVPVQSPKGKEMFGSQTVMSQSPVAPSVPSDFFLKIGMLWWANTLPPYQVWQSEGFHDGTVSVVGSNAWFKVGPVTMRTNKVVTLNGSQGFFRLQLAVPLLAVNNGVLIWKVSEL